MTRQRVAELVKAISDKHSYSDATGNRAFFEQAYMHLLPLALELEQDNVALCAKVELLEAHIIEADELETA